MGGLGGLFGGAQPTGRLVRVAVERGIGKGTPKQDALTYRDEVGDLRVGERVEVPLGKERAFGLVVGVFGEAESLEGVDPERIKAAFTTLPGDTSGRQFFRTGDLGRMDEEGYFFMTDRLKRMINASGYKIWPAEVEMLLYKHPAVQEACIIAARDAYRGETVKACIVLRREALGQVTEQQVIDWAREHMAAYKVPRIVEFVDALPKSGSGKVMWRLLQEREAARADR